MEPNDDGYLDPLVPNKMLYFWISVNCAVNIHGSQRMKLFAPPARENKKI